MVRFNSGVISLNRLYRFPSNVRTIWGLKDFKNRTSRLERNRVYITRIFLCSRLKLVQLDTLFRDYLTRFKYSFSFLPSWQQSTLEVVVFPPSVMPGTFYTINHQSYRFQIFLYFLKWLSFANETCKVSFALELVVTGKVGSK